MSTYDIASITAAVQCKLSYFYGVY